MTEREGTSVRLRAAMLGIVALALACVLVCVLAWKSWERQYTVIPNPHAPVSQIFRIHRVTGVVYVYECDGRCVWAPWR